MKQTHRHNRRRLPPFKAVRAFEAVERLGSMVAAAEELGVTHGAISKQIAVLEDLLGRPLLERTALGVRATAEGAAYAAELRQALDQIHRASRRLFDSRAESPPLRVVAPATFAMQWLIPNLRRAGVPAFEEAIAIQTTQTNESWAKLPFDIAIRRGRNDCGDYESELLFTERLTLVAAPALARRLRDEGIGALGRVPLVESESRPGELQSWLSAAGVDASAVQVSRNFDHFYVLLQAVVNEYGAGIGPAQILADELASGRIETPFPHLVANGAEYRLITRAVADHPLTQRFTQWLRERGASEARA